MKPLNGSKIVTETQAQHRQQNGQAQHKIGNLLESHRHLKQFTNSNTKKLNLVSSNDLFKSAENL